MKKRKSITETKNMVQTAVWLPRDLLAWLKETGGERGLGEEVRRQLQVAFAAGQGALGPGDNTTGELLNQIKDIAADLSRDGPWYSDQFVFDVFKSAIDALLLEHLLEQGPPTDASPEIVARLKAKYRLEKPEDIGLLIARVITSVYARERATEAMLKTVGQPPLMGKFGAGKFGKR
jgi:hypothetical protein